MWDFANKIFVQQSETRRNTHKSSWKKQETGRGKLEKEETGGPRPATGLIPVRLCFAG